MHGGDVSSDSSKPVKTNGMPLVTDEEKVKASLKIPIAFTFISLAIGTGIAFAIYEWGAKSKYDANITAVIISPPGEGLCFALAHG